MSNLKNVLKAGFLVTASFLATGCGSDNDKKTTPAPAPAPGPGGGSTPSAPASVATVAPNIGTVISRLKDTGIPLATVSNAALPAKGDYDVFQNVQLAQTAPALSTGGTGDKQKKPFKEAVVVLADLKMQPDQSLFLDVDNLDESGGYHLSGLVLDGNIEGAQRYVANAKLKGTLKSPMVIVRNAVLNPEGAAALEAHYAYVAVDAAIGYEHARQDKDGKSIALPADVHAIPEASEGVALAAKSKGTAKASKATHTKGVSSEHAKNDKVKATAKKTVSHPPAKHSKDGHSLVLKSLDLDDEACETRLENAGLHVYGKDVGAFDIAGRVSAMETGKTVVTSVNGHHPELDIHEEVEKAAKELGGDKAVKTETKKQTGKKTKTSKSALSASKTKSAKSKSKSVTPKAKDTHTAKTSSKPAVKQSIVKTGGDHTFLFHLKPDFYAEVGKWTVNAGTELHAMAFHSLVVHGLDLKADLGVRAFADEHGLDKLETSANWADFVVGDPKDKVKNGQEMMKLLVDEDHSVHESDLIEEANVTTYQHFDSHTPFALWVVGEKAGVKMNNKKMVLTGVDLDTTSVIDGAGIYMMPLVKDFTGQLPNSSGKTAIAIAAHDGTSTLEVKEWKIMSNGYNDYVVLMQVAAKAAATKLGAGNVSRALMTSKAQGGRSVLSSQLDRVVERLNPTNLIEASFATVATSRINQAAQFASLARGVNVATSEKLGAVEQYAVSFNHEGTQVGFTYNLDGGDAFAGGKGSTSLGVNVASDVFGFTAIASAEASVDAAKNVYANAAHASYNAGLTLAKSYSLGGLSVVPMAGVGFASNAIKGYSAVVPMAAGSLGLHMNDVSFSAATFHAGVNVALDGFVSESAGTEASVAFGLAGYLASTANATLSTSEGKSESLEFGGSAVAPYAQFNLGFASGEKINAMISSNVVAVNFGLDR